MSRLRTSNIMKRIVDAAMTVLLLCLMAYQVTGEMAHEWTGVSMAVLVIIHQILNRKWYGALRKGKYSLYRAVSTVLNILLLVCFALTAFCGMSMSSYAVPFLYGMAPVSFVRRMHLSMSHWAFVMMGLHLGMHIPAMTAGLRLKNGTRTVLACIFACIGGSGLYLFLRNNMPDYLFFRVPFAFLDYDKAGWFVFFENILMLLFWVFIGTQAAQICRNAAQKAAVKKNPLLPVVFIMAAVIIGIMLQLALPSGDRAESFGNADWNPSQAEGAYGKAAGSAMQAEGASGKAEGSEMQAEDASGKAEGSAPQAETAQGGEPDKTLNSTQDKDSTRDSTRDSAKEEVLDNKDAEKQDLKAVDDGFVLIQSGTFLMGSPETENWRIDDETQHEVKVSSFYIDPYETTQAEYVRLMGENPATFTGDDLPVENISWLEAVQYANEKSVDKGLTPVYTITDKGVTWDLAAEGYRLPTEAEWEYACRAGTVTPFNTESSLSAEEANFYGHYPYEIEENYFDNSALEAKPGEYRQTTLAVGSFEPNTWGLFDMHGNVNEWCWDYYGTYDAADAEDPTGAASGTRHIYRGGGWNDFAKNMRSAYRAAGQEDMKSFNLGVRLVRNADDSRSGLVTAGEKSLQAETGGKILIAYFSWSGNTRGIAGEIQSQTGADLFEISPVHPYSTDYNTVLMEAQEDQHKQARPELSNHVPNMDDYDIILLGYPNWWASIPMPIASFLEEYDFSGKTIIPFCSHGGGRFGQSLTAIAKLAPDSVLGEGLSVHYSGGSSLSSDVAAWLKENGLTR